MIDGHPQLKSLSCIPDFHNAFLRLRSCPIDWAYLFAGEAAGAAGVVDGVGVGVGVEGGSAVSVGAGGTSIGAICATWAAANRKAPWAYQTVKSVLTAAGSEPMPCT